MLHQPSAMPNSVFHFKQFSIHQGDTAMKVTTDACIFGAILSKHAAKGVNGLDIGAGTGLLTLMAAQCGILPITSLEIERNAYKQAKENIAASNWTDDISLFHRSLQEYAGTNHALFGLIFSNPPFYPKHLKSKNPAANAAMHQSTLGFAELLMGVKKLLLPDGEFWVLLPYSQAIAFEQLAVGHGLYRNAEWKIRENEDKPWIRVVQKYAFSSRFNPQKNDFTIRNADRNYSTEMKNLMEDFYV